jgi:hypothetical protein
MGAECSDCHTKDYVATTQPSHVASKFPKDCFLCHTERGWQPAKFDHNTSTTFPLTGGHIGIDYSSCHAKGYAGISMNRWGSRNLLEYIELCSMFFLNDFCSVSKMHYICCKTETYMQLIN